MVAVIVGNAAVAVAVVAVVGVESEGTEWQQVLLRMDVHFVCDADIAGSVGCCCCGDIADSYIGYMALEHVGIAVDYRHSIAVGAVAVAAAFDIAAGIAGCTFENTAGHIVAADGNVVGELTSSPTSECQKKSSGSTQQTISFLSFLMDLLHFS